MLQQLPDSVLAKDRQPSSCTAPAVPPAGTTRQPANRFGRAVAFLCETRQGRNRQ
jgi:hypothetical protein